jgi:DNA-binding transcriptional LysR family regulator
MELRQLQYFLLAAQEQSFAKASQKAYVSQQALSKSIISLERELGVPLFERLPHGVVLTSYGQLLLEKAYHITAEVNGVVNDIQTMKNSEGNTIKVALTTGVEDGFSVLNLLEFQNIYPQYRLVTISSNDIQIEEWIVNERIELGILGAKGETSRVEYTLLRENDTMLAVHKDNPLSTKHSVCLADLKNEQFLIATSGYHIYHRLLAVCNLAGFTPNIRHQTPNVIYLTQLIMKNQGIFLSPHFPGGPESPMNHPDIRMIPIEDDPKIFSEYLVQKKGRTLSSGAMLFRNYVLKQQREAGGKQ